MTSKEIEAKFLDVNVKKLREKLKSIGGKRLHKRLLFVRSVFELPNTNQRGYVRVRDEVGKVTMTIKTYDPESKHATETEIESKSNFNETENFLKTLGLKQKAFHQTIREKWTLEGCPEIAIDTIPGINTYVELECITDDMIETVAKKLDLDYSKAQFGAFDKQYADMYGMTKDEINNKVEFLTFNNIENDIYEFIRKNHDELFIIKKKQQKILKLAEKNTQRFINKHHKLDKVIDLIKEIS